MDFQRVKFAYSASAWRWRTSTKNWALTFFPPPLALRPMIPPDLSGIWMLMSNPEYSSTSNFAFYLAKSICVTVTYAICHAVTLTKMKIKHPRGALPYSGS
ncbi:hypothetical protein NPIL_119461 [Nephila pilipes]|uniref:Uncharacterized protein n=1 Tax=Nephila pilipes TaxID=299642 RepID=A0A8X6TLF2_NEPPI|nr:hypothetical protein NPIL_119461 [Nephila pilipes]